MAKEESKTTGHQFKSDTLDATPTARMSGEVHLSLCKGGQIPHSTRKRGVLKHHHFSTSVPQILQKTLHALLAACFSPSTSHSLVLQSFQDGRTILNILQHWTN